MGAKKQDILKALENEKEAINGGVAPTNAGGVAPTDTATLAKQMQEHGVATASACVFDLIALEPSIKGIHTPWANCLLAGRQFWHWEALKAGQTEFAQEAVAPLVHLFYEEASPLPSAAFDCSESSRKKLASGDGMLWGFLERYAEVVTKYATGCEEFCSVVQVYRSTAVNMRVQFELTKIYFRRCTARCRRRIRQKELQ